MILQLTTPHAHPITVRRIKINTHCHFSQMLALWMDVILQHNRYYLSMHKLVVMRQTMRRKSAVHSMMDLWFSFYINLIVILYVIGWLIDLVEFNIP